MTLSAAIAMGHKNWMAHRRTMALLLDREYKRGLSARKKKAKTRKRKKKK